MPLDIFSALPSPAAEKTIRNTVYLTEEMIEWVGEIGKPMKEVQPKVRWLLSYESLL